jgi:cytosine deaminase
MSLPFMTPPSGPCYILANATLPAVSVKGYQGPAVEGLTKADLVIAGGKVEAIHSPANRPDGVPVFDLRDGMVWPCFTDMHTHLDKGHVLPRNPNPDGTFLGALEAVTVDRENHWSAADVATRMDFALRSAHAHGTQLIRTHLDSIAPQHRISFEVFSELREKWKDRIALQAVALFPLELLVDHAYFDDLVAVVAASNGLLGGFPRMNPELDDQLDRLFRAASDNGLDIDLHVDETDQKEARALEAIADAALRNRFEGQVTVGHCCSLARQDEADAAMIVEKVARAGLSVVSLPMCNMYLQDRYAGRTPRWRGVTLFKELTAAGVMTAVSSDNTRDPFYAYGDLDAVEVFREAVRILHLDHPLDDAARIITATPAAILGRPELGQIAVGQPADLVLFSARRWSEFLSRPQMDRIVLRRGAAIDQTLPDYRELDPLLGA